MAEVKTPRQRLRELDRDNVIRLIADMRECGVVWSGRWDAKIWEAVADLVETELRDRPEEAIEAAAARRRSEAAR